MGVRWGCRAAAVAVAAVLTVTGAACNGGAGEADGPRSVPRSLSRAESAAKDTIDLILAGRRDDAIRSAGDLDKLAHRELDEELEGVATKEELGDFQARVAEVARLAPDGEPDDVALAANRALELIARFFGRYEAARPRP